MQHKFIQKKKIKSNAPFSENSPKVKYEKCLVWCYFRLSYFDRQLPIRFSLGNDNFQLFFLFWSTEFTRTIISLKTTFLDISKLKTFDF